MGNVKGILIPACILGLLLTGCHAPAEETIPVETYPTQPTTSVASETSEDPGIGDVIIGGDFAPVSGDPVSEESQGKARVTYRGNESSVRYVTSKAQLPDNAGLDKYDDAFFEEHALVIVTESLPSGSIEVSIDSIRKTDNANIVVLYHGAPQEDLEGTNDMVTWLLWAEVEQGIEGLWTVANPALPSDSVKS